MNEVNNFGFGAIPSSYDLRDYRISKSVDFSNIDLPEQYKIDVGYIKDQGQMGTCTAHSTATLLEYHYKKDTGFHKRMSTTFIYGLRSKVTEDPNFIGEGMKIRDALKAVNRYGDVAYYVMPGNYEYDKSERIVNGIDNDTLSMAYENRVSSYYKIKNESELKYSLLNDGPVIAGMYWFDNCKLIKNVYTYDKTDTYTPHAVVIIGWDKNNWIVQNSWGKYWGDKGLFYIPIKESFGGIFYEAYGVTDTIKNIYVPPNNKFVNILNLIIRTVLGFLIK